jgi:virulence-associated protein VagC
MKSQGHLSLEGPRRNQRAHSLAWRSGCAVFTVASRRCSSPLLFSSRLASSKPRQAASFGAWLGSSLRRSVALASQFVASGSAAVRLPASVLHPAHSFCVASQPNNALVLTPITLASLLSASAGAAHRGR